MATLRLLTWNLWFADLERDRRLAAALATCAALEPDVIAFQELVPGTLARLREARWIRENYRLSDPAGVTFEGYGTVVATRDAAAEFGVYPLPSRMGRKLVTADLAVAGRRLRVGGMHLESLRSRATRVTQLGEIFATLAPADAAVLMGDMNFDARDPEEGEIPPSYLDAWRALRGGAPGYTRDTDRNAMAAARHGLDRRRIDRVFFRPGETGWRLRRIDLVGVEPLADAPALWPSDHFGLAAELEVG